MQFWFNIETGLAVSRYTIEAGLYLTQWRLNLNKRRTGLITVQLGPLWFSIWDNVKLDEWLGSLSNEAD